MNVLLLGAGGREHAFSWKLAQSKKLNKLFIAPGNAGTSDFGTNLNIAETDFEAIKKAVLEHKIEMLIVGPEAPLVKGIYDFFKKDEALKNIPVIGPSQYGAQLEGSKDFSKQFMYRNNVPTAAYATFTKEKLEEGKQFLETLKAPYVLKADGLAAGKGVLILNDLNEAKQELTEMLANAKFGDASQKVVIEEFLDGIELSVFVLTDGISYKILPAAKDYKRIGEGDTGLNTGGMGAVSPVPFADENFLNKVEQQVVIPTINGLKKENIDYKGFVFIGLMNCGGEPWVIEYNCRMGDPETEVVLPRLESDLLELFIAVSKQELHKQEFKISSKTAVTVMCVSGGYPGDYEKGKEITGLSEITNSLIFHAGTTTKNGKIVTNGGRVLAITSIDETIVEAVEQSMQAANQIIYDGKYFRRDIGKDLMGL
ncbi:MAG: phosphoribosylamine--glycine ligase [Bacteroidota bacterium]